MTFTRLKTCKHGHDMSETRVVAGKTTMCRLCANARNRKSNSILVAGFPRGVLRRWSSRYGLDVETFQRMMNAQKGRCAICNTDDFGGRSYPYIDHNHKTGKVRGLLCHKCNAGLGLFLDNQKILEKAVAYLKKDEMRC